MTKAQLQALAVKALGVGIETVVEKTTGPNRPWVARVWIDDGVEVTVWHPKRTAATRALAAALTALAEG